MSDPNLDWSAIRPLSGTRDKGYEELCAQLARCESPADARFIRKGTPDAGVECYTIFPDGSEWAWQAKYFLTSPDASQWQQVNDSVLTALKKHPAITKYFVCMPLDLPDGRVDRTTKSTGEKKRTKSAQDQWDEHVTKWKAAAQADGREVEFVFWGSHELLDRLTKPAHVGRVHFWFDKQGFDGAWFSARLDEALRTAGPRYTPEVHVDLPVAQDFDAFGRSVQFFDRVKALAPPIRDKHRTAQHTEERKADAEVDTAVTELSNEVQKVLDGFGALQPQPVGVLPFAALVASIEDREENGLPVGSGAPRQRRTRPRGERADPAPTVPHTLVSRIAHHGDVKEVMGDEILASIAHDVVEAIRQSVSIDWTQKEAVRADMRRKVKRLLRKHGYPPDKREEALLTVIEQAEVVCKDWASAA